MVVKFCPDRGCEVTGPLTTSQFLTQNFIRNFTRNFIRNFTSTLKATRTHFERSLHKHLCEVHKQDVKAAWESNGGGGDPEQEVSETGA